MGKVEPPLTNPTPQMNDLYETNAPEVYGEPREATFGEVVLEIVAGACFLAFVALVVWVGLLK